TFLQRHQVVGQLRTRVALLEAPHTGTLTEGAIDFGAGLCPAGTVAKPHNGFEVGGLPFAGAARLQGRVDIGVHGSDGTLGQDADDGVRLTLQQHGAADDVRIRPKGAAPDGVADYGYLGTVRSILLIAEIPSHNRAHPQDVEVMSRDAGCL